MPKYAVAYSLLIVYSLSTAMATRLQHVVRQGIAIGPPPATTDLASPAPVPSSRPVTTIGPSLVTPVSTIQSGGSSSPPNLSTLPSRTTLSSDSSTSTSASQPTSITSVSTNSEGLVQTVVKTVQAPTQDSTSSAAPSSTQSSSDDGSIKPATIIGLSVVGGIAVLSLVAFIVWKLTRKRFSDLDDTDDTIKWPELNRPELNREHLRGDGLSRQASNPYPPSRNASALDQSENDPYAVPPLPQFNPNQPYRDDPGAHGSGYYDPYRGPVPQAFHDNSYDGHESIPMSTYPPGSRTRSPGPGASYDPTGRGSPVPGRASPAPGAMQDMGGRGTPLPGRTMSPGPVAALGTDRRPSPGPQYSAGGQPEMVSRTNPGA